MNVARDRASVYMFSVFRSRVFVRTFLSDLQRFNEVRIRVVHKSEGTYGRQPNAAPLIDTLARDYQVKGATVIRCMGYVRPFCVCFRSIGAFKMVIKCIVGTIHFVSPMIITNTTVRGVRPWFNAMGAWIGLNPFSFSFLFAMGPINVCKPSRRCPTPARMKACFVAKIKERP